MGLADLLVADAEVQGRLPVLDCTNRLEFGLSNRNRCSWGGTWYAYAYQPTRGRFDLKAELWICSLWRAPDGLEWPPGWSMALWAMHHWRIQHIDGIRRRAERAAEIGRVEIVGPDLGGESDIYLRDLRTGEYGWNTWHCIKKGSGIRRTYWP